MILAACLTLESGLRANRDTRTPMQIALVVTLAKIALNGVFIFGWLGFPRLELVGAGLATLASQVLAVVLFGVVLARAPQHSPTALHREDLRGSLALVPALVRIALPGIAERVVMNLAMLSYFVVLGSYGTAAVAAYTIGVRILSFSWIPGTGYAQAVGTLVGQSLGAGDEVAAERAGWRAARLAPPPSSFPNMLRPAGLGRLTCRRRFRRRPPTPGRTTSPRRVHPAAARTSPRGPGSGSPGSWSGRRSARDARPPRE